MGADRGSSCSLPDPWPVVALGRPVRGAIRVPGSKSLTNRLYVLAALAKGRSVIEAPLASDDTDRLLVALERLGATVERSVGQVTIDGCGGRFPGGGRVDLGDGGTPTRFVLALATLARSAVEVDGSERMRERPVDEGIALLRRLGASIDARRDEAGVERLPVVVRNGTGGIAGGELEVGRTASSQFLSALLLIAPSLAGGLHLRYREAPTSASYLDLTVDAMRSVGLRVDEDRDSTGRLLAHRVPEQAVAAGARIVEPDASSAAYFALLAAIVPGSRIELLGLSRSSRQPDLRFLDALASMGARVEASEGGVVVAHAGPLAAVDLDASLFPDASMALAIACATARGRSVLRGLGTLRVKESDRVAALATELTRLGCEVEATADTLAIGSLPPRSGPPVAVATYRDHRMAMSFTTLGLLRGGIAIVDPGCVGKSYPGFFTDLHRLCGEGSRPDTANGPWHDA